MLDPNVPVHVTGDLDTFISFGVGLIGILAIGKGYEIWKARNGGWFTRALAMMLLLQGLGGVDQILITALLRDSRAAIPLLPYCLGTFRNVAYTIFLAFVLFYIIPMAIRVKPESLPVNLDPAE